MTNKSNVDLYKEDVLIWLEYYLSEKLYRKSSYKGTNEGARTQKPNLKTPRKYENRGWTKTYLYINQFTDITLNLSFMMLAIARNVILSYFTKDQTGLF